jgi:hypothetical protein
VPTEAELIQTAIATSAKSGIASASNDSGSVTKLSIDDQIKAANYLAGVSASAKPGNGFGLRFSKIIPPGAG